MKKILIVEGNLKEENTNLYLISMNKNYDKGEIKFKDSSAISIKKPIQPN